MHFRATVLGVSTAVPEFLVTAAQLRDCLPEAFHLDPRRISSIHAVIDHARVSQRHLVFPPEYILTPRPLEQVSCEYKTHAIELGQRATQAALDQAQLQPQDIDLILAVSCTGLMIPSLDAYLINLMGFRSDVKRVPITELGCAAGAAALARAADYLRAFPDAKVLVLAVELPSLTFQADDLSPANLISCCLFGDGAAAAILTGRETGGLQILDTLTHLVPNTPDAMGFELRSTGLRVILSKDVPQLVKDTIGAQVNSLLARNGISRRDLEFFVLHPGGQKLLRFVEEELGLEESQTAASWKVLDRYGNLSAATVLFVLKEVLSQPAPRLGAFGLMASFGPGFSIELALLQWN